MKVSRNMSPVKTNKMSKAFSRLSNGMKLMMPEAEKKDNYEVFGSIDEFNRQLCPEFQKEFNQSTPALVIT